MRGNQIGYIFKYEIDHFITSYNSPCFWSWMQTCPCERSIHAGNGNSRSPKG